MPTDPRQYAFFDAALGLKTNAELRAFIHTRVGIASQMSDGSDPNGDVRSDYAKSNIEQARDILLGRGEVFTAAEKAPLHFLSWPSTQPAPKASSGSDAAMLELNPSNPDGFGASTYATVSSAGFLRQAAFARESLLQPADKSDEE